MTAEIQSLLDYNRAVANWYFDCGEKCRLSGDFEGALKYYQSAAGVMVRQNRELAWPELERALRNIAQETQRSEPIPQRRMPSKLGGMRLHVMDEALPAGGLTSMAFRWIQTESEQIHSVALLAQGIPVPRALSEAVRKSGGTIYLCDSELGLVERALWLRNLAAQHADLVVLHAGVADVIFPIAFGVPGGPPVTLVNHAAHLYWVGSSICDLVLNCRGSSLEEEWTRRYRGASCATVPIPLARPGNLQGDRSARVNARADLGIEPGQVVLLSVGAAYKYRPLSALDFLVSLERFLLEEKNVVLLIAGFDGVERWNEASLRLGGRIRTLGALSRDVLKKVYAASDIYIESFPFGSTTSLLEAGMTGIPVVLAPETSPPPYGTDGVAVDKLLVRPSNIAEYVAQIRWLSSREADRFTLGKSLQASILGHHTGEGWGKYLRAIESKLPAEHQLPDLKPVQPTPVPVHEYWAKFNMQMDSPYTQVLEHSLARALAAGLRPRFSDELRRTCREYASLRAGQAIPSCVLRFLCNWLLPLLPKRIRAPFFRAVAYLYRVRSIGSMVKRARRWIGGESNSSLYEAYRRLRA